MRKRYAFYSEKPWALVRGVSLLVILNFCSILFCFSQENITLTTYYPAPFGIYLRLSTNTLGVGDTNGDNVIDAADAPNPVANPGDVWIAGDVGIGTTTPQNELDVSGYAAIGANYAGTESSPGLLVEGNVGIGTISANFTNTSDLVVNHALRLSPNTQPTNPVGAPDGTQPKIYYSSSIKKLVYSDGTSWYSIGGVRKPTDGASAAETVYYWNKSYPLIYEQPANSWRAIGGKQAIKKLGSEPGGRHELRYDNSHHRLVFWNGAKWRIAVKGIYSKLLPNYQLRGTVFYAAGANALKYWNGTVWKELKGFYYGPVYDEKPATPSVIDDPLSGELGKNDTVTVKCPNGYAATQVFIRSGNQCAPLGAPYGCLPIEIKKVGLRCRKIVD